MAAHEPAQATTSPTLSGTRRTGEPVYRRLHRAFFAACILLAPITLSLLFALCPTGANDPACPDQASSLSVLAAFRGMNAQLLQLFLLLSLVIPYVYTLSYPIFARSSGRGYSEQIARA